MKLKASSREGFELVPADNHVAVLVAVVDLGTHNVPGYQGAPAEDKHQIYLCWELVDCPLSGTSNNHLMAVRATASMHKKATLRGWCEAMGAQVIDDQEFDPCTLLGRACLLEVEHEKKGDRVFARVKSVGKVHKSMQVGKAKRALFSWDLETDPEGDKVAAFPSWLAMCFGEEVKDVVVRCYELGGTGRRPTQGTTPRPQSQQLPSYMREGGGDADEGEEAPSQLPGPIPF